MPTSNENYAFMTINFGHRVKSLREALGLTQADLARRVGVSKTTIQNYEAGNIPKGGYLYKLSRALKCSLDHLLVGEESPYFQEEWLFENPSDLTEEELAEFKAKKSLPKGLSQRTVDDGSETTIDKKQKSVTPSGGDFHLSMGDSMELLVNIHKSGNNVLIRAINANLMAFNEAIENRERAETTINAIAEMREQMKVMNGEIADLRHENQDLRQKILSREDQNEGEAVG